MLKSSLRQSFKKLRKLASHSGPAPEAKPLESTAEEKEEEAEKKEEEVPEEQVQKPAENEPEENEEKKEKEPEQTVVNLCPGSREWAVRSVSFACTCLLVAEQASPVMFLGTGSGAVFMYDILAYFEETPGDVKLCKELQLQHRAPVLALFFLDAKHQPIAPPPLQDLHTLAMAEATRKREEMELQKKLEEEKKKKEEEMAEEKKSEETKEEEKKDEEPAKKEEEVKEETKSEENGIEEKKETKEEADKKIKKEKLGHDLVVCTEEQVKLFSLPALKPKHKYKFVGGLHVVPEEGESGRKRIVAASLQGMEAGKETNATPSEEVHKEWYLVATISTGSVSILSLPTLRRQVKCSVGGAIDQVAFAEGAHSVVAHCPVTHSVAVIETCASTHHLGPYCRSAIQLQPWMRTNTTITEAAAALVETVKVCFKPSMAKDIFGGILSSHIRSARVKP
ncbi:hypothetical protein Ciccas_004679 [Cichlidogyrus casuarinus]|uniref:Uncharacterized protein n=1 Tax=Cichlidogyrus casuarinus TaxID=1844966 RepID=A0ABD2QBM2_9PLAT